MSRVAAIIPVRWGSTRFPGKPLHGIAGKPLIQHVWRRCVEADIFDQIIVAADDMRIIETAFQFGAEVALTSPAHPSGTDRIAEVAKKLKNTSMFFNIQGDEPLVDPKLLRKLVKKFQHSTKTDLITAACPISSEEACNQHVVKVVTDRSGLALFFSRSPIPFAGNGAQTLYLKHLGVYGFRRKALLDFVNLPPSPLETAEQLEQLRALENGMTIRVIVSKTSSIGVDTPEDARLVEQLILGGNDGA
ncbi:MAG: 3-deoxy-manno-octulosonate cytidylyltransferase [Verrucomicrobia bacterium]|nr:3-deoxy-manno-octulosonate cytidylyltransferase [Verrucomicrobiota bacterium]MBV9275933.1 3-deoxy-manno-octulosonate cytidylyltransferase [Verrucomicrobiota bacterium]